MSVKKYTISGLAEACPLCIEGEKRKGTDRPIFQVTSDGGYTGPCCAPHLAALIKAEEPARATPAPPARPAMAAAAGNAVPAK